MVGGEQDYNGFRSLDCYKYAVELRRFISELAGKFPSFEKYHLTAQIVDSSRSITRNIAEGYGRFTFTEKRNFFIIARGSVTETMDHLDVAFDEKYIAEEAHKSGQERCKLVFRLVNGYIGYLERSNQQSRKGK